ncbi:hypothetical protein MTO96_027872 [Rhipicephalus appendiculatus]
MESERWPETRFPARFHPDLTAISERPSEELALREAHQARFESSNEPAYWSTESGTREERSPPANGTVAKVRTQRSKQNVADQAFGDNDDGPNWLHDPTTLPDSPSVRHGRLQRRAGGYFRHRASSLRSCRTRVNGPLALKDGGQRERPSRAQRAVSPVYEPSQPDACSRCALTTFLIALSVVCVVAVLVDIKRRSEEVTDQSTTASRVDAPATAAFTVSSTEKHEVASACKKSCMHNELPAESCFEKTLFSWCSRQDVSASWWLFNGKHCRPWHFPGGLCPDFAKADVFASQQECLAHCFPLRHALVRTHAGRRRRAPCRPPKVGTVCDIDVLKFPYFADITSGSGRVRCLKASAPYLLRHRCLIGSNHFSTETACKRTCSIYTAILGLHCQYKQYKGQYAEQTQLRVNVRDIAIRPSVSMATNCREKTRRRLFQERDTRRSTSVDSGLGMKRQDASLPTAESTDASTLATASDAPVLRRQPVRTPPRPSRRSLPAVRTQRCTSQRPVEPSKSPSTLKHKVIDMFRRNGREDAEDLELSSSYVTGDQWTPTCRDQNLQDRPLPERFPDFIRRSFRRKSYRVQKPHPHLAIDVITFDGKKFSALQSSTTAIL